MAMGCSRAVTSHEMRNNRYFELSHDVVCACAKRDEPPQPPEPFSSFVINILFHFEILSDVVGPAARHFVRLMVKFVCIRVHSWLKINDLVAANDRFKKNQCNLCDLWFP